MSGSEAAIDLGLQVLRNGATAALLGLPANPIALNLAERVIFKGLTLLGINGRRMYETWYQMEALVTSGRVDPRAVITHVLPYTEFDRAFELMEKGEAVKIVLDFKGDTDNS